MTTHKFSDLIRDNRSYWRDKDGVHHVPKRKLDDIIIGEHGIHVD